jgi:hypothetical protein
MQQVFSMGAARIRDIVEDLAGPARRGPSLQIVTRVIQSQPGFRPLDRSAEWFTFVGLAEAGHRIRRILSVCPRLSMQELLAALRRDRKRTRKFPPADVLSAFCREALGCQVAGDEIVVGKKIGNARLSRGEAVLVDMFRHHGPICRVDELKAFAAEAGVKWSIVLSLLARSSLVAHHDVGIYGLVGARQTRTKQVSGRGAQDTAKVDLTNVPAEAIQAEIERRLDQHVR